MADESVVVGVRVRPFNAREKGLNAELCIEMSGPTTRIYPNGSCMEKGEQGQTFAFDESFWSHDGFDAGEDGYCHPKPGSNYADQQYVYNVFGKRVLDNAWAGFHACLFAYGQTGAGKSYSMVGYGANRGIVPIACEEIFKRTDAMTTDTKKYEVTTSMVEIYNETVQDLLILPEDRPKKGLDIRESKLLGIYIDGVTKRPVSSYAEIEATVEEATEHRTVGSTLMNATSSRAHTVVSIEFKQVELLGDKKSEKISMINLVDLAGSEKAGQTGAGGDRLKEGAAINKSLSALGLVIEKLALKSSGKKDVLVPYRDSKLTRLLQNALGGSSKTIMICALSPASSNYEETLSTLRYADRAKKIKNTAKVNENPQDKLIRELREENAKLKAMMEELSKGGGFVDTQALQEQRAEIEQAEEALTEMQRSFEDKYQEDQAKHEQMRVRRMSRRSIFAPSGAIRAVPKAGAKGCPYLANLNEDTQLTGRIKHDCPPGRKTIIGQVGGLLNVVEKTSSFGNRGQVRRMSVNGSVVVARPFKDEDDEDREGGSNAGGSSGEGSSSEDEAENPDIMLVGPGIFAKHATVSNVDHQCYLMAKGKAAEATFISGRCFVDLMRAQEEARTLASEEGADEDTQQHDDDVPSESAGDAELDVEEKAAMDAAGDDDEKGNESILKKEGCADGEEGGLVEEAEKDADSVAAADHQEKDDEDAMVEDEGEDEGSALEEKEETEESADTVDKEAREGVKLQHGDCVVFGRLVFIFVDPIQGSIEHLIFAGTISHAKAMYELEKANWKKNQRKKRPDDLIDRLLKIRHHEWSFSDGDEDPEAKLVADLRRQLEAKDKEIHILREEVAHLRQLRTADCLGPRRNSSSKAAKHGSANFDSIKTLREMAAELRKGFDLTSLGLGQAMKSLGAVRKNVQAYGTPISDKMRMSISRTKVVDTTDVIAVPGHDD